MSDRRFTRCHCKLSERRRDLDPAAAKCKVCSGLFWVALHKGIWPVASADLDFASDASDMEVEK